LDASGAAVKKAAPRCCCCEDNFSFLFFFFPSSREKGILKGGTTTSLLSHRLSGNKSQRRERPHKNGVVAAEKFRPGAKIEISKNQKEKQKRRAKQQRRIMEHAQKEPSYTA
jgi:hypothetical protein